MSMPDPAEDLKNYVLPVSAATYREIRTILIAAGQGGLFIRHQAREAIDMTGLTIIERRDPL